MITRILPAEARGMVRRIKIMRVLRFHFRFPALNRVRFLTCGLFFFSFSASAFTSLHKGSVGVYWFALFSRDQNNTFHLADTSGYRVTLPETQDPKKNAYQEIGFNASSKTFTVYDYGEGELLYAYFIITDKISGDTMTVFATGKSIFGSTDMLVFLPGHFLLKNTVRLSDWNSDDSLSPFVYFPGNDRFRNFISRLMRVKYGNVHVPVPYTEDDPGPSTAEKHFRDEQAHFTLSPEQHYR